MYSLRTVYRAFMRDSLSRNSVWLAISNISMSGLGFIFWLFAARITSAEEVGIAATLISVITIIVTISLLGLNVGIIRFLNNAKHKDEKINAAFLLSILTAIVASTLFVLLSGYIAPSLSPLVASFKNAVFFILSLALMTAFTLIESVFIAYRAAQHVLIKNVVWSVLKILSLPLLIGLGAWGLFLSWTLSAAIAFIIAGTTLIIAFGYHARMHVSRHAAKKLLPYSMGIYAAGFAGSLPTMVLPLLSTELLGPASTAYYYIAIMIANLLFLIPMAITDSLFAEGAADGKRLHALIGRALLIGLVFLTPAAVLMILLGHPVLSIFGIDYAARASGLLYLFVISSPVFTFNVIAGTVLKLQDRIRTLIRINLVWSGITIALTLLLIPYGLRGIGFAWIAGQGITAILYLAILWNPIVRSAR